MDHIAYSTQKYLSEELLMKKLVFWRWKGEQIVFTNGCFDVLHAGHVTYLQQAASLGKRLVVGLNSDASVSRLKGPQRPVNKQDDRALVLASLMCVDAVVVFEEDTPINLIHQVAPDILCKGGDYTIQQIVGAQEVLARGGRVEVLPFLQGYSSTGILDRLISANK